MTSVFLSAGAVSEEYAEVHKCDERAAHPNDPNRWAAGVLDEDIVPGPAIAFCTSAVKEYPDTPRFLFQLGRALWAGQRHEDGIQAFRTLEETYEYPPVYAYLADAYMHGIGGTEVDQELAVSLYQIAADEGFAPASEVLASLTTSNEEPEETETKPAVGASADRAPVSGSDSGPETNFVESWFNRPKIVSALNSGNFSALRELESVQVQVSGLSGGLVPIYLNSFAGQFEGTYNYKDQSCIYLYNPRVASGLKRMFTESAYGGKGLSMGNNLAMGLNMVLGYMNDIETTGGQGLVNQSINLDLLKQSAEQDAGKLITAYGCKSEIVRRIYKNLEAYVFHTDPHYSPEELARLAEIKRMEAEEKEKRYQASLRSNAKQSCFARFEKEKYCSCLITSLDSTGLSETNWLDLAQDFSVVLQIAKKTDGFASQLKSCRARG